MAFRRAMSVFWDPLWGRWRRLSSGTSQRAWALAHLRGGGRAGLVVALGAWAFLADDLRGIVRSGEMDDGVQWNGRLGSREIG